MLKWHKCSCSSYSFKRQHHSHPQMRTLPKIIMKKRELRTRNILGRAISLTAAHKRWAGRQPFSAGVAWDCTPGGWGHCPASCAANPSSQRPAAQKRMEALGKGEAGEVETWPVRNELSNWPISHSLGAGHWGCRGKYWWCQQGAKECLKHLEFHGYICLSHKGFCWVFLPIFPHFHCLPGSSLRWDFTVPAAPRWSQGWNTFSCMHHRYSGCRGPLT